MAPLTEGVDKLISLPLQTGPLLVAEGVAGVVFTTTVAVPAAEVHPPTVTVTLYVPAIAVVAFTLFGVRVPFVYEPGPVHAYVAPESVGVDNAMVDPVHTGDVAVAVGIAGVALIITVVVPAAEVQPLVVTVKLYVPPIAAVAEPMLGLCVALE